MKASSKSAKFLHIVYYYGWRYLRSCKKWSRHFIFKLKIFIINNLLNEIKYKFGINDIKKE